MAGNREIRLDEDAIGPVERHAEGPGQGHLVEQRLEEVVIPPIKKGDADRPAGERAGSVQSAEASSHYRYVRKVRHVRDRGRTARAPAPGPPLPHRYARVFWRTNACTRFQASAEASANSVCFRSKKLCGAPG
jgi:hypothetical protein